MNKAIREWFDWRGWVVVSVAVAVTLGLLAILSPTFRGWVAHPTTAAWAAAFGSFAAAGAALIIAYSQFATQRKANRLEGAIALARLNSQMSYVSTQIMTLDTSLGHPAPSRDVLLAHTAAVKSALEEVPISAIVQFDKEAAMRLIYAIDTLQAVIFVETVHAHGKEVHVPKMLHNVAMELLQVAGAAVKAQQHLTHS